MKIGDEVKVDILISGRVVGRTYEKDPRVDLLTPWGTLTGIPLSMIQRQASPDRPPAGVALVPQGSWPSRKAGNRGR